MSKNAPFKEIGQTVRQGIDPQATEATKPVMSTIRVVSGWATASTLVLGTARAVSESVERTAALVRQLRARPPAREETFGEAVARLNLTEQNIAKQLDQFQGMAANWFIAFSIALIFLAWTPVASRPVSQFVLSLGVALWTASRALHWHFRSCQVRDRELYSFGPWFRSDVWVRRVSWISGTLITLLLLLMSTMAHAQGAPAPVNWGMFSPDAGDPTVGFLREVFGSVIDQIHGGSDIKAGKPEGVLGNMLVPFNGAVLFLGMIFIVYTTIKGTVDSAHDGEILGRKMSSIWVPMRTLGGTAILLPLGSGYSLVQIAILWLALQAVGIANTVLNRAIDEVQQTNMVSLPHLPSARALALDALTFETCRAAMNATWQETGRASRIELREIPREIRNSGDFLNADAETIAKGLVTPAWGALSMAQRYTNAGYQVVDFDWGEVNGGSYMDGKAVCGSLRWQESKESSESNGNLKIAKGPIMAAQAAAVRDLIKDVRPIAESIVAGQKPNTTALNDAVNKYEKRLMTAAKGVVNQTNDKGKADFLEFVREGGWIYLPTYYNQMIHLNDALQSALNSLPESTGSRVEELEMPEEVRKFADAKTVINELNKTWRDRSGAASSAYEAHWKDDVPAFPKNWDEFKAWISAPATGALNQITQEIAGSNLSHIGQIKSFGDTVLATGWTMLGAYFTGTAIANAKGVEWSAGLGFNIGAALSAIGSFVMSITLVILLFGVWAAFYIPMIPYIMGITAIIKWFVLVFESVIAAPIFAVAHIHPDGDDTVGRAGPGYMLILGNIMRPTLVVFGFFGSIWLAQPITSLINNTYMTAVVGAQGNSVSGLGAFVAYSGIYCMLMTGVVHSIFSLVNWLPDNVLRWIGGSLSAHGVADTAQESAQQGFRGAVAGVVHLPKGGGAGRAAAERPGKGDEGAKAGSSSNDAENRKLLM